MLLDIYEDTASSAQQESIRAQNASDLYDRLQDESARARQVYDHTIDQLSTISEVALVQDDLGIQAGLRAREEALRADLEASKAQARAFVEDSSILRAHTEEALVALGTHK